MKKWKWKKRMCQLLALAMSIHVLALPQAVTASEPVTDMEEIEIPEEVEILSEVEDVVVETPFRDRDVLLAEGVKTFKPSEDVYYELTYEIDEKGVVITGVVALEGEDSVSGELIIPAKIEDTQVYKIGDKAFYDCDGLYGNVNIPEGVQLIDKEAFYDCDGFMGGVSTPSTLTIIGEYAFYDCDNMAGELVMAEGLVTIDNYAFYKCSKLNGGSLPESIVIVGDYAFYHCDNILYNEYVGLIYSSGNEYKNYSISLYSLKLPRNLKAIGESAFVASYLYDYIPHNPVYIGDMSYHGFRIRNIYITSKTTKIGENAFGSTKKLTDTTGKVSSSNDCSYNTIYAPDLSYAQVYANEQGYGFVAYDWQGIFTAQEINLDNTNLTMQPWEVLTLTAEVLPDTARDKSVTWSSSDETVLTVSEGKVTAVGYGTATITATTVNGHTANCQIIVQDPTIFVDSITLSQSSVTLYLWQEEQLTAKISPNDATDKTIEWTTSNEEIATVKDGLVTAVDYGTATITATSPDGPSATCTITVKKEFPFEDVDTNSWQYKGIDYVYQKGLMNGTDTTEFAPNNKLTRTQFVVVLYSYAGKPNVSFTNRFTDVKNGQWYSNAVIWAVNNGVTSGYTDGNFGIADNITREQFVLMLYKYAVNSGKVTTKPSGNLRNYADYRNVSSWASEAMLWAVQNELMSGKPQANGTIKLDPQGNTTRAECAAMMMQFDMKF